MEKCIDGVKSLIDRQVSENKIIMFGKAFSEYQKTYFWTNENIDGYLDLVDFNGKSNALSVMASGDHPFSLIVNGIYDIDTFDTNKFTEYYVLGLKKAMILKYNYYDFISIMNKLESLDSSIVEVSEVILGLLPFMDEKYRIFWKTIVDYNIKVQRENNTNLSLIYMIFIGIQSPTSYLENNSYLVNEEKYNLLRERISKANITFKCANAANLDKEFKRKCDFILLSNILDYFATSWGKDWDYDKFLEYEKMLEGMTKSGGTIFLKYIMMYASKTYKRHSICSSSFMQDSDLQDEELYILPRNSNKNVSDGIVLKRVK